jgi:hypothetical protein
VGSAGLAVLCRVDAISAFARLQQYVDSALDVGSLLLG